MSNIDEEISRRLGFNNSINHPPSTTPVKTIVSDVPSTFVSRYDVCFRAVLEEGTLSYAFILADLFVSLPPFNFNIFLGVDYVLRASSVGCLIGSVGLARVLDLLDCLLYYWRNMVIPLFVNNRIDTTGYTVVLETIYIALRRWTISTVNIDSKI